MFNLTSPIAGSAITGLTSPTYTLTADVAPSPFGKQFAVTALGGTQAGVVAHSISSPFTATFTRPSVLKQILLTALGIVRNVPINNHKLIVRKGVACNASVSKNASVTVDFAIPAGSETYDKANLDALFSFAAGVVASQAQGIRNTVSDGIV